MEKYKKQWPSSHWTSNANKAQWSLRKEKQKWWALKGLPAYCLEKIYCLERLCCLERASRLQHRKRECIQSSAISLSWESERGVWGIMVTRVFRAGYQRGEARPLETSISVPGPLGQHWSPPVCWETTGGQEKDHLKMEQSLKFTHSQEQCLRVADFIICRVSGRITRRIFCLGSGEEWDLYSCQNSIKARTERTNLCQSHNCTPEQNSRILK